MKGKFDGSLAKASNLTIFPPSIIYFIMVRLKTLTAKVFGELLPFGGEGIGKLSIYTEGK